MSRIKASLIHLCASLVIACAVGALILLMWYPGPYALIAGGSKLMLLVVGCDVILGPLLTLIVFNPTKQSLRRDIGVVLLIQLAALVYGIHVAAAARPVFGVLMSSTFDVIPANDLVPDDFQGATGPYNDISWTGPRLSMIPTLSMAGSIGDAGAIAAYVAWDTDTASRAGNDIHLFRQLYGENRELLDELDDAMERCALSTDQAAHARVLVYRIRLTGGWVILAPPEFRPCAAFQ